MNLPGSSDVEGAARRKARQSATGPTLLGDSHARARRPRARILNTVRLLGGSGHNPLVKRVNSTRFLLNKKKNGRKKGMEKKKISLMSLSGYVTTSHHRFLRGDNNVGPIKATLPLKHRDSSLFTFRHDPLRGLIHIVPHRPQHRLLSLSNKEKRSHRSLIRCVLWRRCHLSSLSPHPPESLSPSLLFLCLHLFSVSSSLFSGPALSISISSLSPSLFSLDPLILFDPLSPSLLSLETGV